MYTWKFTGVMALSVMIGAISTNIGSYYANKHMAADTFKAQATTIRAQRQQQMQVDIQLSQSLRDYESLARTYQQTPLTALKKQLIDKGAQLDKLLDKASAQFGLPVKREADQIKVLQYALLHPELQPSLSNADWSLAFLHEEVEISKKTSQAEQDYDNVALDLLLYGDHGMKKADAKTQAWIQALYQKTQSTLPAAIAIFKNRGNYLTPCMEPDGDYSQGNNAAIMVAQIQYESRYCAFMVQSKTKDFCTQLKTIPPISDNAVIIAQSLALCQIAQTNLAAEKAIADKKYAALSYEDYFKQFVAPLLPQAVAAFEQTAMGKNLSAYVSQCDSNSQPVVSFRDPTIDAKIAAYTLISPIVCRLNNK